MLHKDTRLSLRDRLTVIGVKYWTLVCLLACIDVLGPLAVDAHLPSLPQMTVHFHSTPSWLQFTILSYALMMAISSLFGGLLLNANGKIKVHSYSLRPIFSLSLSYIICSIINPHPTPSHSASTTNQSPNTPPLSHKLAQIVRVHPVSSSATAANHHHHHSLLLLLPPITIPHCVLPPPATMSPHMMCRE